MTIELFPVEPAVSRVALVSTPVTNPEIGPQPSTRRTITLPARRRRPSSQDPHDELRDRRMRDATKWGMADAVWTVLAGLEATPLPLTDADRLWLGGLIRKPCRAHRGALDAPCPGPPDCGAGVGTDPLVVCDHDCPGTPDCPGSLGRLLACSQARAYQDLRCGEWGHAEPLSCHVPACPDCEPQRQAKHALHYEAIVGSFDWRDIVLAVFTARNPRAGELHRELRAHVRDLARLRSSPIFTGDRPCLARTPAGAPFHPCAHAECAARWRCRRYVCGDIRKRRRRRGCSAVDGGRGRCVHPDCRPNCRRFRHRGVRAGVFAMECPPSTATPGTWNLHTNGVLVLRDRRDGIHKPWLAEWREVSWYWSRSSCRKHRRCPGRPRCDGGAWDVHLEAYEPRAGLREYLKYVTKPADVLDYAGAGGMVEFMLARRRVKFLSAFGHFFGSRFVVDPEDQAAADAETVMVWISNFRRKRFPKICARCGREALWDGFSARMVQRVDLELAGGFLCWRGPPQPPPPSPAFVLRIPKPIFVPFGIEAVLARIYAR